MSRPLVKKYKPLVKKYKPLVKKYKPLVKKYKPLVKTSRPLVKAYCFVRTLFFLSRDWHARTHRIVKKKNIPPTSPIPLLKLRLLWFAR